MATTAAVLSILVDANTTEATSKLSRFDKQLVAVNDTAKKGIEARLGADYNPRAFDQYQRAMTNAERRAKDRAAFKAELGANFNPRAFNQYERAIERADASSRSATASTKKMSTAAAGAGSAIMGWGKKVAEAAGVIGGASVYAAIKFQSATETLQTQAGASTKQVDALRKGILNMAQDVGATPDKLAAGMYHVVSSMNAVIPPAKRVSTELHIQKVAAEGAAVGHSDLEETTYALASAMNALRVPFSDAKNVMGEMNAIVGAGDLTMGQLLDTMKSGLLPAARTFGISFQSVGAALAVMGDKGIQGAAAGTKLRMSIALLGAPSKQAATLLEKMGLSTDQVTAAQSRMSGLLVKAGVSTTQLANDLRQPNGISVALTDLKKHLEDGGLSAEASAATISRAFGGGRSGATIQLLLQNTDRLNTKFHQIGDTAGNFGKSFQQTQKTVQFQLHALEGGVTSLGIKLGDMLLPSVQKVVQWLNKFVHQMQTGQGAGGKFARDVKSAFDTAKSVVKKFVDTVGGIKPALEIAAGAFVGTKLLKFSGGFARDIGSAVGALKRIPRLLSHLPGLGKLGGLGKASQTIAEMNVTTMIVKTMIGGGLPGPGNLGKDAEKEAENLAKTGGGLAILAKLKGLFTKGVLPSASESAIAGEASAFGAASPGMLPGLLALGIGAGLVPSSAWGIRKFTQLFGGTPGAQGGYSPLDLQRDKFGRTTAGAAPGSPVSNRIAGIVAASRGQTLSNQPFLPPRAAHASLAQINKDYLDMNASLSRLEQHQAGIKETGVVLANLARRASRVGDSVGTMADSFGAALLKTRDVASGGVKKIIDQLKFLPPAARAQAALSMLTMSRTLERSGALPKGTTARLAKEIAKPLKGIGVTAKTSAGQVHQLRDAIHTLPAVKNVTISVRLRSYMDPSFAAEVANLYPHMVLPGVAPAAHHRARGGGGGGGTGGGGGGDGGAAATQHKAARQQAAAAARQRAAAARQHAAALAQQAAAKAQRIAAAKQAAFLAFWARIPSQAAGQQIKSAQIANRLQLATNTGNVGGQTKALNAERRLDKQWIAEDKRKLQKLNGQLRRKGLSRKTRNALLQDKLGLIQEITTIEADIGNVATSLQSLGGSTGGFDLMPGSVTLPTPYDVRHAIGGGHQHHHHGDIHIHVNKDADVTKVADVIDRTMNSQIHSRLRRAGLRGT